MKFTDLVQLFLKKLEEFDYSLSGLDHQWVVLSQAPNEKWYSLLITKYEHTFYLSVSQDSDLGMLVIESPNSVLINGSGFSNHQHSLSENDYRFPKWSSVINSTYKQLCSTGKNWIKANKLVAENYPLKYRYGVVPHSLVQESFPNFYNLRQDIGVRRTQKFIKLVEEGYFLGDRSGRVDAMTATKFFDYCKIAYIAAVRKDEPRVDKGLSGLEMYKRFADNRHEGLLDIDPDSEQEFADWIDNKHPKRQIGGHPWEIKRGGNTTHINLCVYRSRYDDFFTIKLQGAALNRLAETIKMFLAIHKAGLPVMIDDPEGIRKRLLGLDNIGLIPSYRMTHRANQHFEKEQEVYDVLHYDDLGRYKRRMKPFITWEPLPILKPRCLSI